MKHKRKHSAKSFALIAITAVILALVAFIIFRKMQLPVAEHDPNPAGTLSVHMIDVGQGDALLIETDGKFALIDSGPPASKESLVNYLDRARVRELEYLIFTHPHEDHIGGGSTILEKFKVKSVILSNGVSKAPIYKKLLKNVQKSGATTLTPKAGYTFALGKAVFTVISPLGTQYEGLNEFSTILRLDYGQNSMLFTGDAESANENELIVSRYASLLRCDLLKVGHHGSVTSTSDIFLVAVNPKIAFISCGVDNEYGHPHDEILQKLSTRGCKIYRTDYAGSVVATSDGKTITVKTEG